MCSQTTPEEHPPTSPPCRWYHPTVGVVGCSNTIPEYSLANHSSQLILTVLLSVANRGKTGHGQNTNPPFIKNNHRRVKTSPDRVIKRREQLTRLCIYVDGENVSCEIDCSNFHLCKLRVYQSDLYTVLQNCYKHVSCEFDRLKWLILDFASCVIRRARLFPHTV